MGGKTSNDKQIPDKTQEEIATDLLKKFKLIAPAPESPQPINISSAMKNIVIAPAPDHSQPSTSQQHESRAVVLETTPLIFSTENMGPNQTTVDFSEIFPPCQNTHDATDGSTEDLEFIYIITTNTELLPSTLQIPNGDLLHILNSAQVNAAVMPCITGDASNPVEVSQLHINQNSASTVNTYTGSDNMLDITGTDLEFTAKEMNEEKGKDVTQPIDYSYSSPVNKEKNLPMLLFANPDALHSLHSNKANAATMSQPTSSVWNSTEANLTQSEPPNEYLYSNAESLKRKREDGLNMKKLRKSKPVLQIDSESEMDSMTEQPHLDMNDVIANIIDNVAEEETNRRDESKGIIEERLNELMEQVDPSLTLANNVTDILVTFTDRFLEEVIKGAATFAKFREVNTVEIRDLQHYLDLTNQLFQHN